MKVYIFISVLLYPVMFMTLAGYVVFFRNSIVPMWAIIILLIMVVNFVIALGIANYKLRRSKL